ncbi:acetyltransferase, GNAT family [Verrucomicrobiia bacterium DG1235]|nr:acetyltransferase, GNAT family [Verrucomicrobiae bacterium DG1235]
MCACSQSSILFETDRLVVRSITQDDVDSIYAVYSAPKAMRWVGDGQPIKYNDCIKWVEVTANNYASRGYGLSALQLSDTGEIIGFCGLVHPNGQHEPEIKYALLERYWGKGYASECVKGMIQYGHKQYGMDSIIATVAAENAASQKVLAKCDMRHRETITEDDNSSTLVFAWSPKTIETSAQCH